MPEHTSPTPLLLVGLPEVSALARSRRVEQGYCAERCVHPSVDGKGVDDRGRGKNLAYWKGHAQVASNLVRYLEVVPWWGNLLSKSR